MSLENIVNRKIGKLKTLFKYCYSIKIEILALKSF